MMTRHGTVVALGEGDGIFKRQAEELRHRERIDRRRIDDGIAGDGDRHAPDRDGEEFA